MVNVVIDEENCRKLEAPKGISWARQLNLWPDSTIVSLCTINSGCGV